MDMAMRVGKHKYYSYVSYHIIYSINQYIYIYVYVYIGAPVIGLNDSGGARIQEGVNSLGGYAG